MALSIKTEVADIPSILKMLGLGGMPAESAVGGTPPFVSPDSNGVPPVDSSVGGSENPTTSPEPSMPPASTHDASSPPTKLLRLQQALGTADAAPAPPPLTPPGPAPSMPPADLAGSLAAGTAKIKPTFQERHPNIFKTLGAGLDFVENAGPGIGAPTFGQGFAIAAAQPAAKKKEELELATGKANLAHTQAATEQMKSQVTLPNGLTVPFALASKLYPTLVTEQGKNARNTENVNSRESIAGDKQTLALRKQGLKLDANGKQVPLGRDEMSETEQAHLDLQQSQQEAAAAKAAVDRAKNDPNSPAYKAAIGRLQVAQRNADTAAGRLGIESKKYAADYLGVDAQGNALPGAQIDEKTGRPIGPRMANANNPSADRTRRGDLAANAIHNLNNIENIITRRGDDLFGPIMGRITNVRDMIGSDDPDISAAGVEIHNYALAANGAHGVRSQQAIAQTEDEILKHFKRGPTGATGGITAAKDSLLDFVKDQQLGKRARPSGNQPAQSTSAPPNASAEVYAADGETLIGHAVNGKYVPLQKQKQ